MHACMYVFICLHACFSLQHAGPHSFVEVPTQEEVKQKEEAAIKELKSLLPPPLNHKIYDLYQEYEKKETLEAKIVSALDKLEANLQANQYKDGDVRYWKLCENGAEYYKMALQKKPLIAEIGEKILSDLENAIIALSRENMKKCRVRIKK